MQIHELNSGTPAASDVIAMDTGSDTYKATADGLIPTFTSGDAASPTAWASVSTITSGLSLATLFNRISTMVKNVRWLYTMLGTTSISGIGNGTVTGALSNLNGRFASSVDNVTSLTSIPNGFGYYQLAAAISPTGTQQYYAMVVSGNGSTRKSFLAFLTSTNTLYVATYHSGSNPEIKPWQQITTTAV